MTSTIDTTRSRGADADTADLAALGYAQVLHRRLGPYSSFAAGFSFVSILTTVTEFFGFGYSFGSSAFFWTWPLVFVGQVLVALCFAEMAAQFPIAGCIYQWSRRLAGAAVGFAAGWLMLLGQIVSVAAAAIALQSTLPTVWSGFQFIGTNTSFASSDGATNAVILGGLLIVVTTVVNAIGVQVMARINDIGVTCELVGVVALVALLFVHADRGPGAVLKTNGVAGHGSYVFPFLASTLMACYVMYGFDSAGELSEETVAPRLTAPRSILRALAVSGIGGGLLLIAAIMAARSLTDPNLSTGGLSYIITDRLGTGVGKIILVDVSVAVCVCTLAIQTAGSRMLFSLSRDGVLPGSSVLARVSGRTGTPVLPSVLIGALAIGLLVLNAGQSAIFAALGSVGVVLVYGAYLAVTAPLLVRRLRGGQPAAVPGRFSLGRWGLPVNLLAVVWGGFITVNTAWPRAAVYDPAGGNWALRWFAVLFLAGAAVVGTVAALVARRSRRAPLVVTEAALA
ncbi:MAG TPA: amino acid permease [Acidimicrobiales bacterium]|nr:amino acid permease [Acidimicrobiales bacterium]